jgi:hypothetical protein
MNPFGPVFTIHFVGGPWHGTWVTSIFPDPWLPPIVGKVLQLRDNETERLQAYQITHARLPMVVVKFVKTIEASGEEIPDFGWPA